MRATTRLSARESMERLMQVLAMPDWTEPPHAIPGECDNVMDAISALEAERDRLRLRVLDLEEVLRLIAADRRPDGSWNHDRESCRQLAVNALDQTNQTEAPDA